LSVIPHEIIIVYGDKSKTAPVVEGAKIYKIYGDSLENAILTGFTVATYNKIVVMDGDGSHPPNVIPKLLQGLDSGADIAIASRFLPGSSTVMSPYRKLIARFFRKIGQITGGNCTDPMSGFFALNKRVLDDIQFKPFKWKVLYEILKSKSVKVVEVPYVFKRRKDFGGSKVSVRIGLGLLWDILITSTKLKHFARLALTIGIVGFIFHWLNIRELITIVSSIRIEFLGLSVLTYVLMSLFMVIRLKRTLRIFGAGDKYGFMDIFWGHTTGMLLSDITPGKVGYLVSVPILSKMTGIEKKGCLSAVLGIQSVELVIKGLLALISVVVIVMLFGGLEIVFPALVGILTVEVLGLAGIGLLLFKPFWLEDVPILGDVAGYLVRYPAFKTKSLEIGLVSLLCWFLRGIEWFFLGLALGMNIPFYVFLILHPLLTAVRFLPLTPASLGVFELALIWGFIGFGVSPELSFIFGLLDRFDNIPDIIAIRELLR